MIDRPWLPLVLLDTPPGLELILAQEGVPFVVGRPDAPYLTGRSSTRTVPARWTGS